jgi:hypothetical protein
MPIPAEVHGDQILVKRMELANMLLSAFRYALGRRTYITMETAEWLIRYWGILPDNWQSQIQQDIERAIARGDAGMQCDVREWQRVLELEVRDANHT